MQGSLRPHASCQLLCPQTRPEPSVWTLLEQAEEPEDGEAGEVEGEVGIAIREAMVS